MIRRSRCCLGQSKALLAVISRYSALLGNFPEPPWLPLSLGQRLLCSIKFANLPRSLPTNSCDSVRVQRPKASEPASSRMKCRGPCSWPVLVQAVQGLWCRLQGLGTDNIHGCHHIRFVVWFSCSYGMDNAGLGTGGTGDTTYAPGMPKHGQPTDPMARHRLRSKGPMPPPASPLQKPSMSVPVPKAAKSNLTNLTYPTS